MIDRNYGFEESGRRSYDRFNRFRRRTGNGLDRVSRETERMPYDKVGFQTERGVSRISEETTSGTFYACIDEAVGRPRTEIGIGNRYEIKELGKKYDDDNFKFIMLLFSDKTNKNYCGVARVYFSGNCEDMTKAFKDYVNRVKCALLNCMREQNPNGDLEGMLSIHGSADKAVLDILKKRIKAEEIPEENYIQ